MKSTAFQRIGEILAVLALAVASTAGFIWVWYLVFGGPIG